MQLLRGGHLLGRSKNAAERCEAHHGTGNLDHAGHDSGILRDYVEQVGEQKSAVDKLLIRSDHVLQTVRQPQQVLLYRTNPNRTQLSEILQYRNDEAGKRIIETIREHNKSTEELSRVSARESEAIAELIKQSRQDSRIVKALTVVASLYLPATMVASIFNSNLVQTVPVSSSDYAYRFQVSSQFWMFPAFTLALMVASLAPLGLWIRYNYGIGRVPVAKSSP